VSVHDGQNVRIYFTNECGGCPLKSRCTTGKERRVRRWEHEHVVDAARDRLEALPEAMTIRRRTVEHPFGTLKAWMGHTHFLMKGLAKVNPRNEPVRPRLQFEAHDLDIGRGIAHHYDPGVE
jgi:DDE family transposase